MGCAFLNKECQTEGKEKGSSGPSYDPNFPQLLYVRKVSLPVSWGLVFPLFRPDAFAAFFLTSVLFALFLLLALLSSLYIHTSLAWLIWIDAAPGRRKGAASLPAN